jgi:hypothetical protein
MEHMHRHQGRAGVVEMNAVSNTGGISTSSLDVKRHCRAPSAAER